MGFEIEAKFYIHDIDSLLEHLAQPEIHKTRRRFFERNFRYENETETLTSEGRVLRLREDDRVRLTYKEPYYLQMAEGAIARSEWETDVSSLEDMQAILEKLGFQVYMIYEKFRAVYMLNGAQLMVDEMPFGNFLEIEGPPAFIESAALKLGIQSVKRIAMSYTEIFDAVKDYLGVDFRDLTFENFEGIEVPHDFFMEL